MDNTNGQDPHDIGSTDRSTSVAQHTANAATGTEPIDNARGHVGEATTQEGVGNNPGDAANLDGAQAAPKAPDAEATSRLEGSGDMRIAEKLTIRIRGNDVWLLMAGNPVEKKVDATELAGFILDEYFGD